MSGEAGQKGGFPEPPRDLSRAMEDVYDAVRHVAPTQSPVLICGEPGARKLELARLVHTLSPRADGPFVTVSRPELTELFVEGVLFTFEGTASDSPGLFRKGSLVAANKGTLFLDEVLDLPLGVQARLEQFLESCERGAPSPGPLDVRLVAATTVPLREVGAHPRLYPRLIQRLQSFFIDVPPLRECKADILRLAQKHLVHSARSHGKPARRLSPSATAALLSYPWPHNEVELESYIERAVLLCEGDTVGIHHLPPALQNVPRDGAHEEDTLQATLDAIEKALIVEALKATRGNQAKAAETLGTTERLMGLRVRKHGIDPRHFRTNS